ncbi:MAG TPA: carboxylating nicotinate-nucleotide diphosphorylase [bacterium (Candidatus Stahlbacteria)]|nr:carboxylating nicotinate-nucleotide diphosphorylase [Candidatus Stahlbacteria bacterium]
MRLSAIVKRALKEDIGKGDVTTNSVIPKDSKGKAVIVAKKDGVLAGMDVACEVFKILDPQIKFNKFLNDGDKFKNGMKLLEIYGSLRAILTGERTALNFLTHLSGIATLTSHFVEKVRGTKAKILDTRKTIPGLRELAKYAVKMGGGENHRFGLHDAVLIKDNHIAVAGGIREAVERLRKSSIDSRFSSFIEVEVENLFQLKEALSCDVDRIMLDNMNVEDIKKAVEITNGRAELEVSGGVNLDNVRKIAETGVDYISVGSITHSAKSIDMSLEVL